MSHTDSLDAPGGAHRTDTGQSMGGAVSAAEGVCELELDIGLVSDLKVIAPDRRQQPDLPRTRPEGSVHHAARGEGGGGGRIVRVDKDHDARQVSNGH